MESMSAYGSITVLRYHTRSFNRNSGKIIIKIKGDEMSIATLYPAVRENPPTYVLNFGGYFNYLPLTKSCLTYTGDIQRAELRVIIQTKTRGIIPRREGKTSYLFELFLTRRTSQSFSLQ